MPTKTCFKCGVEKPLHAFYRHAQMRDKHLNKCVQCTRADVSAHRINNLERIRQYDKDRANLPHRKALRESIVKAWERDNPQRKRAQSLLNSAVRCGRVQPWPCMVCGNKAEAHHPCYDMPLDVVWLCRPHHMQAHALVKD